MLKCILALNDSILIILSLAFLWIRDVRRQWFYLVTHVCRKQHCLHSAAFQLPTKMTLLISLSSMVEFYAINYVLITLCHTIHFKGSTMQSENKISPHNQLCIVCGLTTVMYTEFICWIDFSPAHGKNKWTLEISNSISVGILTSLLWLKKCPAIQTPLCFFFVTPMQVWANFPFSFVCGHSLWQSLTSPALMWQAAVIFGSKSNSCHMACGCIEQDSLFLTAELCL